MQGHSNVSIIEADGQYTKPRETSFLQMGSGQRYSVLLQTKSVDEVLQDRRQNISTYYMQLESRDRPTVTTSYAVLNYLLPGETKKDVTAPAHAVMKVPDTVRGWLDYDLAPLKPNNFPALSEVTRRVVIKSDQLLNGSTGIIWAENNLPWEETFFKTPYLVALYKNETAALPNYDVAVANGGMDPMVRAFPARMGEVLESVLQNSGSQTTTPGAVDIHPFHAHGAHYYNIGSGNGTYDVGANERLLANSTPVLRDTTMLFRYENKTVPGGDSGWRAWRLRVTQPGVWMIHCHILQHLIMGMQTSWVFGNASDILTLPRPVVQGYLDFGGSAVGNATHPPSGVQWYDAP